MSYMYKIDEVEKCLNDVDGCMMVSHRMLQKQFFTDEVRTTAAASMAEGREILKSVHYGERGKQRFSETVPARGRASCTQSEAACERRCSLPVASALCD